MARPDCREVGSRMTIIIPVYELSHILDSMIRWNVTSQHDSSEHPTIWFAKCLISFSKNSYNLWLKG